MPSACALAAGETVLLTAGEYDAFGPLGVYRVICDVSAADVSELAAYVEPGDPWRWSIRWVDAATARGWIERVPMREVHIEEYPFALASADEPPTAPTAGPASGSAPARPPETAPHPTSAPTPQTDGTDAGGGRR